MNREERQNAFISYYHENNATISETCEKLGIPRSTYYKWKNDDDFLERFNRTAECYIEVAKDCIFKAMRNGDTKAAMWYLERKGGFEKKSSEQNINVNHRAIAQIEIPEMTEEKFANIGAKAKTVIPKTEDDVMALANERFGDDFTYTFDEQSN